MNYAVKEYREWQGTYFSMFIQALLSPINNYGMRQLRCIMTVNSLLLFASLLYLIFTLLRNLGKEYIYLKFIIAAMICFMICGYTAYTEIFFWFSGATSYSFPFSFMLIGIACFIKIREKEKNAKYIVIGIVCGIMAMGGSLTVTGTGCFVLLLIYLYKCIEKKNILKSGRVLAVWALCACINAFAPGNFVRHELIDDSGVHVMNALQNGLTIAEQRWDFFFNNTNFALFMMLFVLFGYLVFVKRDFTGNLKIRLVFSFLGIFTPVVTAFPLALGYSGINVPNRCEFVLDMSIIITDFNLAFTLGILIAKRIKEQLKEMVVLIMTVAASVYLMLDGFEAQDIKITEISKELQDGIYEDHYYSCKEFYKSLETYEKGSDVIISKEDFPTDIENTQNIILSKDPTMWINTAVAQYYGFHTISVLK